MSMPRKLLFLIADGMGDYPLAELGGQTPMEKARTPNMDRAARQARIGRCHTIPEDMPPGSDIANMALLGYDPHLDHTGRGPIEAAAQGLEVGPGDLIYRMNLCTVSQYSPDGVMLDHSGGHLQSDQALEIIHRLQAILDTEAFTVVPGFQYRHLLIQKGGADAREAGLDIPPPHDILNQSLARAVSTFESSHLLGPMLRQAAGLLQHSFNTSKANTIWPWGQGRPLELDSFQERFNLTGGVVSAVDLVKGLGRAAGMTVPDIPTATGLLDTDYQAKVQAALELLTRHDFVFVHLEGPDECGHAGNIADKVEAIQRFDEFIVGPLLQFVSEHRGGCVIACDHLTPIACRTHTRDPVPFLVLDTSAPTESGFQELSEKNALQSDLVLERGDSLLPFVLKSMEGA
jgi:2,3-bisphosphoglycerate-independent phosphoglycerate mutase